jgi:aspartate-semialdehyde dehydrogenase
LDEVIAALGSAPGVSVTDTPPCPADHEGADPVHVGRIRTDPDEDQAFWIWAVSDQLRKGAALNAIQIAEKLNETRR